MNTKDMVLEEEALALAKSLTEDDNTVEIAKTTNGSFRITWIKNKKYTSWTGHEHTDEVWTTENGTMLAIQDIGLDHARNIIRMMLRNNRKFMQSTITQLTEGLDDLITAYDSKEEQPRTLH